MLIVDRLEADMVIIEYSQGTFALPRCLLPPELAPGDVLKLAVTIDAETTAQRRQRLGRLLDSLWETEPEEED